MATPIKQMQGKVISNLTVLSISKRSKSGINWLCRCSCGNTVSVQGAKLRSGKEQSCRACSKKTHGMSRKRAYRIWSGMVQRCTNPNVKSYERYGGRGIKLCHSWKDFINFYNDMGDPPKGFSIDRINNDGNYEPDNCRWANKNLQAVNTSANRLITMEGETLCITDWIRKLGLNKSTVFYRIGGGMSVETALRTGRGNKSKNNMIEEDDD